MNTLPDENIEIIFHQPEYARYFKQLNEEWIRKYFTMEKEDEEVLSNPDKYVLKEGGYILYAKAGGSVIGTVAVRKTEHGEFELTKMGVAPESRGSGIGKKLLEAAIQEARKRGFEKLVLYSNTSLGNAIGLYRKFGFMETLSIESYYQRCNIKMELRLLEDTPEYIRELIERYGKTAGLVEKTVKNFPEQMWTWKPPDGKWSIHENLIHLADSEANSYIRCRRLFAEPGSTVFGYEQDVWAKELMYHNLPARRALALFSSLRLMTYELLKIMPEEKWGNTINHTENGEMNFVDWLKYYENHTHIGQMNRVFTMWKKKNTEN